MFTREILCLKIRTMKDYFVNHKGKRDSNNGRSFMTVRDYADGMNDSGTD